MTATEFNFWKNKYTLKELELNALLEITQAVNDNLPRKSLYKIYINTLRPYLKLKPFALYVKDKDFNCEGYLNTNSDYAKIPLHNSFFGIKEIAELKSIKGITPFDEFDTLIPVYHKNDLLAFVFSKIKNEEGIKDDTVNTNFIQTLTNIIIVAIENKKLYRQQLRQEAELEIARNVQQYLFPKELPDTNRLQMHASYFPHHSVGGDYYDYIPITDQKFLFCIGDVSGKGIPAALLMSNFQASLRTLVRQTDDPEQIIRELNFQTLKNGNGEHFITFFMALYNLDSREFKYVNAGHNPPFLCLPDGQMYSLESGTTILGSFPQLPFLNVGRHENLSQFYFFSYTDGLPETRNPGGDEFGTDRLKIVLIENAGKELKFIHNSVMELLDDFKGDEGYLDDITIFSCRLNLEVKE